MPVPVICKNRPKGNQLLNCMAWANPSIALMVVMRTSDWKKFRHVRTKNDVFYLAIILSNHFSLQFPKNYKISTSCSERSTYISPKGRSYRDQKWSVCMKKSAGGRTHGEFLVAFWPLFLPKLSAEIFLVEWSSGRP
jgi:hypothetical protein